jgi:hypothetical protein
LLQPIFGSAGKIVNFTVLITKLFKYPVFETYFQRKGIKLGNMQLIRLIALIDAKISNLQEGVIAIVL